MVEGAGFLKKKDNMCIYSTYLNMGLELVKR